MKTRIDNSIFVCFLIKKQNIFIMNKFLVFETKNKLSGDTCDKCQCWGEAGCWQSDSSS